MSRATNKPLAKKRHGFIFSDNWFESRKFPAQMCEWIRELGKVPYVRLMLRSDAEQNRPEKTFLIDKIIGGEFDEDFAVGLAPRNRLGHRF